MGEIIRTITKRGEKVFHSQFKAQLYAAHPNIYVFIDILNKLQANTYEQWHVISNKGAFWQVQT